MATPKPKVTVRSALFPQDHTAVSVLFAEYAASLNIDLSFQNFEHELASLPGKYDEQLGGALLLASVPVPHSNDPQTHDHATEKIIGTVALRHLPQPKPHPTSHPTPTDTHTPSSPAPTCELKRLYIVPSSRNIGAGRTLLDAIIQQAQDMGYKEMMLDTLPTMQDAIKMYKAFGFEVVEKYYDSPIEGTCFMRLRL
ncbi:acyl-CoA N-acyltransferase [Lophiostoma macrostomum CBS 122681]|uniref:Acyl-CoA N-acyltransferase n=1 Tax=Lophiostoma macrostomum CBS 122681 TaxID=1314788 RepID=A0A6A6SS89_9PLEO|nr:acyl-CoA N-acyltransferase [Lophiostoma macrostomum CBS 122681]